MTDTLTAPLLATTPAGERHPRRWAHPWRGHGKRRVPPQQIRRERDEAVAMITDRDATIRTLTHDLTQAAIQATGQADMQEAAAVNANLRKYIDDLHGHLRNVVMELGAEQAAHAATRDDLATAVRANEANSSAVTVTTDISSLGLPQADEYVDLPPRDPEFPPHRRALPLWDSPLATAGVTR